MKPKLFLRGLLHATTLVILQCAAVRNVAAQYSNRQPPDRTTMAEIEVPFRNSAALDAILVKVKVNGKDAVLIFDTGSNRTIISHEAAGYDSRDRAQFQTLFPESKVKADARWGRVNLEIAGHTLKNRQVVVKNQDDLSRLFKEKIDGILGKDILNGFEKVTIDFPAHSLRLSW